MYISTDFQRQSWVPLLFLECGSPHQRSLSHASQWGADWLSKTEQRQRSIFTLRSWEEKYGHRETVTKLPGLFSIRSDWTHTCGATPAPDGTIVVTNGEDEGKKGEEIGENSEYVRWLTCGRRGYVHWSVGQNKRALTWGASEWVYYRFEIPIHSLPELFHHLTPHDLRLTSVVHLKHYKGQRPINVLQEVDTDLISQWMIISGLTRHWFVQGQRLQWLWRVCLIH